MWISQKRVDESESLHVAVDMNCSRSAHGLGQARGLPPDLKHTFFPRPASEHNHTTGLRFLLGFLRPGFSATRPQVYGFRRVSGYGFSDFFFLAAPMFGAWFLCIRFFRLRIFGFGFVDTSARRTNMDCTL